MACGVLDIRIDVLTQFADADGVWHVDYFYYVFDKQPLYFEMPSRYSPGLAADICSGLKDDAEKFVERKYGNSPLPVSNNTIANAFYNYLSSKIQQFGGRLTKSANYPNTPVSEYQETVLPGGCS